MLAHRHAVRSPRPWMLLAACLVALLAAAACDPAAGGPTPAPGGDGDDDNDDNGDNGDNGDNDPVDPPDVDDLDGDGTANALDPDMDGDGTANASDDDIDGDGIANADDPSPRGSSTNQTGPEGDIDGDGLANVDDDDDDGDGIPDGVVGVGSCGTTPAQDEDSDCDGFCLLFELGYEPCEDGADPGVGRPDDDGDGIPDAPPVIDDPGDPGLDCGHIDVDTSHLVYPIDEGRTDGHVHEYDDKYDVTGFDAFATLTDTLRAITTQITDPDQRFKIIVGNAALSPGARIVINQDYDPVDATSYTPVGQYAATPLDALPVFSLGGTGGTTALATLQIQFDPGAIAARQVHPTNTGDVRGNTAGAQGEARNGALLLQVVAVDATGADAFATDPGLSNGGVHGVATDGLLYEISVFWHWRGPSYHEAGWATYDPTGDLACHR